MNNKDTFFLKKTTLNCNGVLLDLTIPKVMGILNYTPDSFYDGGRYADEASLVARIETLAGEGADIIDVGCYSSRPGAEDIPSGVEKERLKFALDVTRKVCPDAILSVDTFRPEIAEYAVCEYGVAIINDITAGYPDGEMFITAARVGAAYIMMHMKGNPRTMVKEAAYDDMIKEIIQYFSERISMARDAGIRDIIVDPGFGFAKDAGQSFEVLRSLDAFKILGLPVLAGLSRKSLIWRTLGIDPAGAGNGTTVLNTLALMNGADILRVHDVKHAREAVKLFLAYQGSL